MNIPTSVIVVLLVVAWLVVLVPMIARRRERVPQSQPGGSGFRVLRRASASLRRRPGRGAKGRTVTDSEMPDSTTPTEALVTVGGGGEQEPMDASDEWAAAQASAPTRTRALPVDPDADQDDDQPPGTVSESPVRMAPELDGVQAVDDRDLPPGDELDEHLPAVEAIPDEVDEQEWADHVAAGPVGSFEVNDEQFRPVPRRAGRGGFDPEAAEATRAYRYQQRRRVTLILAVATVAFTVASLLLFSWLWFGAALSAVLLVGYLGYLRRQVRIEAAIRQKRMERVQRARQIRPEYGRRPQRARAGLSAVAPGRTVVDLDDDDPGFDDLEEYHQPMTYRRAAGQ